MDTIDEEITFQRWQYPHIDGNGLKNEQPLPTSDLPLEECTPVVHENTVDPVEELKNQLIEKEQELSKEIELIKNMSEEIKTLYTSLTEELFNDGMELIKNITRKVIQKEFEMDEALLQKEINQAMQFISSKDMACKLFVSSDDYPSLKTHFDSASFINVKADTNLAKGKFLFKTPHNEIEFDWEKRLNELFKV